MSSLEKSYRIPPIGRHDPGPDAKRFHEKQTPGQETRSTKSEAPNLKQARNPKHEYRNAMPRAARFGHSKLVLWVCLDLVLRISDLIVKPGLHGRDAPVPRQSGFAQAITFRLMPRPREARTSSGQPHRSQYSSVCCGT